MVKKSAKSVGHEAKGTTSKSSVNTHVEFSGPLPPPGMLDAYDRVVPGAAERLLRMAEREQANVHLMRKGPLASVFIGQLLSASILLY